MSNKTKVIYGENLNIKGHNDTPVKIEAPDSSLALVGTVNIVDSAAGADAGLTIDGVDILDYTGTQTVFNTVGQKTITESMSVIIADHPDSNGNISLNLPLISTLSTQKHYFIEFKGAVRHGNNNNRRSIIVQAFKSGATGDHFDGGGEQDSAGQWHSNSVIYSVHGSIDIRSVTGKYTGTGSTTNGWVISSSALDHDTAYKIPARVATTGVVVLDTAVVAGQVIDGITLVEHDLVIVKDQMNSQNGVYTAGAVGAKPQRDLYWKAGLHCAGWVIKVRQGTTNAGKVYEISDSVDNSVIGSDAITFNQTYPRAAVDQVLYSDGSDHVGDAGMTYDGTNLSVTAAPTTGNHVTNKTYVDGLVVTGVTWKNVVTATTTAALILASDFENGDVIDGVTLATGDRILIKDQAVASENGIYTVNATGAPTRAVDFPVALEARNTAVFVSEGTANADFQFVCTNDEGSDVVGTDALVFTQFAAAVTPGGANTQIQFNNAGAFGGDSLLTFDGVSLLTDDIDTPTGTGQVDLYTSTTSGRINFAAGQTTGDVVIGAPSAGHQVSLLGTDDSTSITTGAFVTGGGVGVSKKMYVGDLIDMTIPTIRSNAVGTAVSLFDTTTTGNITMGASMTTGDISLGAAAAGTQVKVLGNSAGTTTAGSGALAVTGGASFGSSVLFGNDLLVGGASGNGTITFGSFGAATLSAPGTFADISIFDDATTTNMTMGAGLTSGNISFGTAAQTGSIKVLPTADATSTTTGALRVSGGAGIVKKLFIGDLIDMTIPTIRSNAVGTAVSLFDTTTTGNITMGAALTTGDISLGAAAAGTQVKVLGNSAGTTTAGSGALAVTGGASFGSSVLFGNDLLVGGVSGNGTITFGSFGIATLSAPGTFGDISIFDDATTTNMTMGAGLTSGNISFGKAAQTGSIKVLPTADATSTTTGALRVSGGMGVVKKVYLGDSLTMSGKGTVTQITSDVTPVTLNASSGRITTVSQTLATHAKAAFTVTNSYCAATSVILATINDYGGSGSISCTIDNIGAGTFDIILTNTSGTTLDAVAQIGFLII